MKEQIMREFDKIETLKVNGKYINIEEIVDKKIAKCFISSLLDALLLDEGELSEFISVKISYDWDSITIAKKIIALQQSKLKGIIND